MFNEKCLQQKSAKELENEISDKGIFLDPLYKSIEDLTKAATKINNERKVCQKSVSQNWHKKMLLKHQIREV